MAPIIRYRPPRWIPIAALLFLFSVNGFARTWKDASGNFEVDAEFVKVEGGAV
jgi:hypothetical protein